MCRYRKLRKTTRLAENEIRNLLSKRTKAGPYRRFTGSCSKDIYCSALPITMFFIVKHLLHCSLWCSINDIVLFGTVLMTFFLLVQYL